MATKINKLKCVVVGPASIFEDADRLLLEGGIDVALLDFKIHGQPSFRIADRLRQLSVPFAFITANREAIGPPVNQFPILTKPFSLAGIATMLDELKMV